MCDDGDDDSEEDGNCGTGGEEDECEDSASTLTWNLGVIILAAIIF